MTKFGVVVIAGAMLAFVAGCSYEGPVDGEAQSDQLDIEVGRKDYVNGIADPEPNSGEARDE